MTQFEQHRLLNSSNTMKASEALPKLDSVIHENAHSLESAMQRIFSSTEETHQVKARWIMGAALLDVADEELEVYLTELRHLINSWLDAFERQVFDGETLKELLD
jgi:hypothetical protein